MNYDNYIETELAILESFEDGEITESQRDELLDILEEKAESSLGSDEIEEFFGKLVDQYPKTKKYAEKIQDMISDEGSDDDDESDDGKKEDDGEVSEAALDFLDIISNL